MNSERRIPLCEPVFGDRELANLSRCIESGWVSAGGEFVGQLEEDFSRLFPGCHAAAVSSGTAAMFLALRALGVPPASEVVVQDITFAGTINPVIHLGARPLLMDIDEATLSLDPERLEHFFQRKIIRRNGVNYNRESGRAVTAVIVAHLYGLPARIDELAAICARYGVPLIEDAAESLGATWGDQPTGSFGRAAVFSLNGNKLVTGGSGGVVVSSDPALIREVKRWSDHYRSPDDRWSYERAGYNYQMSNLQAAVAVAQLEQLAEKVERKRQLHEQYAKLLRRVPEIRLIDEVFPGRASYWLNVIQIEEGRSENLIAALAQAGIEARPLFKPLHQMAPYQRYLTHEPLTGIEVHQQRCCLPSSENLTLQEQEQIIERALAGVRAGTTIRSRENV